MKRIILPLDGFKSSNALFEYLESLLTDPQWRELIAYVKVNDALHDPLFGGPHIVSNLKEILKHSDLQAGVFLDLKIADVSATVVNTIRKYESCGSLILTVNSACSLETIFKLRSDFPEIQLAMFAVPTDMAEEECQKRHGMPPVLKILSEYWNINSLYERKREVLDPESPFDFIVCSPKEVEFLKRNLPDMSFIVPGIRDEWMLDPTGHQKRTTGVKEAIDIGADLVVMGAQLTKGNPKKGISAEESRRLTLLELAKAQELYDPLTVLKRCGGYYAMPEDGPLVAYAGTYKDAEGNDKNYVGKEYFNFAQAEHDPRTLRYFADKLQLDRNTIDLVIGAPMGGIKLATMIGDVSGIRSIFAEKKVIEPAKEGRKEVSKLVIDRHIIRPGDRVAIIEDVCNNFSTTQKLKDLIEAKGGVLSAIVCAFNRSGEHLWGELPVYSALFIPTDQYRQDDPEVAPMVAAGNVCWKAKDNWEMLLSAMHGVKQNA